MGHLEVSRVSRLLEIAEIVPLRRRRAPEAFDRQAALFPGNFAVTGRLMRNKNNPLRIFINDRGGCSIFSLVT